MAKLQITEERLTSLIEESIYELLQEAEYDENVGHWLGDKYQTARNRWNQLKGSFKAGRSAAWDRDKNFDPYAFYGDNADNLRNMDGPTFAAYRLQLMTDLYNKAPQEFKNELGSIIKSWRAELNKNNGTRQGTATTSTSTTSNAGNTTNGTQNAGLGPNPGVQQTQNTAARISEIENMLKNTYKQQLVNGHWQFQDQNGKITPTTAESNRRYHPEMYKLAWEWEELNNEGPSGLSENKKRIQQIVNESVNKTLKKYFKK